MDKKQKFVQSSPKGTATETKKSQDVANSKIFPKNPKRRESNGANNIPKNDQPKKNYNSQKTKAFDKRPKPKGQYHGSSKEDTKVIGNHTAEHGSVIVQGSKKQNFNHLLNFHYESRDAQRGGNNRTNVEYYRSISRWLPPIQRHKYNKEQFLQASCQFVVSKNGDYTFYLNNPDALVDWKFIEQIKVHTFESFSCPICLCPPVAAKMTRCGHVYCWPCILHYLSLSDKTFRTCPICYEQIRKSDLKSVVEVTRTALNVGDHVTLRLMRRERGSLLATPVDDIEAAAPSNFFFTSGNFSNQVYSKLLMAQVSDIMDIIEFERVQLNVELMDNPDTPENCYIEEALIELSKREEELFGKDSIPKLIRKTTKDDLCTEMINEKPVENLDNLDENPNNLNISSDDYLSNAIDSAICGFETQLSNSSKFTYFYQANDGQHLYLHAMNVKMLEMQYGSLEHCPRLIEGKLIEKEVGSYTEELRKRIRYLCHLPLTCQFEIAEIELKPPLISDDVLSSFREQLESRQRQRQRREREEKKREKKITEEENKRMGRYKTPNINIESNQHFPQWQPEILSAEDGVSESIPSSSSAASSPSSNVLDDLAAVTVESGSSQEQGPSFAEMLRNKSTKSSSNSAWPSISSRKLPQSCGNSTLHDELSDEKYHSAPAYNQSFGDALAHAFEQQSKLSDTDKVRNSGGNKKKKKGKSTVLFTTNMPRLT